MRAIGRILPGPSRVDPAQVTLASQDVLFMRSGRIDDMIMATSLIRVIASALKSGKVDVLATPATAPVLEGNPHVGKVITLDPGSLRSHLRVMRLLRKSRYPVMVDGRINDLHAFTSTPLLMLAAGARFRVGAAGEREPRIYNVSLPEWDRDTHYIDGSRQLAIPFGIDPETVDWQPELFLSREERSRADERWREAAIRLPPPGPNGRTGAPKRLLVNLSASEPKGRWPDGKFIAALQAARLSNPDMPVIVIGLPDEWTSVQEVASRIQGAPVQANPLREALALVATADLVFTPDTSIAHAASAFRKPSLILLKREQKNYRPYNTPGETVTWAEGEIQKLPHERVSAALDKLIMEFGR